MAVAQPHAHHPGHVAAVQDAAVRAASARAEVSQTTTRRENASRFADSHSGLSSVGIMVRSVTHSRFDPFAVKSRCTRSGARSASGSRRVKPLLRRGLIPVRLAWRREPLDALAIDVDALTLEDGAHAG